MVPVRNTFSARFESALVDRTNGVIFGVAVITEGPALGHGVLVDSITLAQVKSAAETYSNGLKVKMTHGGDAGDIVGALRGFRLDGPVLRADLHLLKSYEKREYVMELAETIPDTFGLSISFSGPDEKRDGKTFARCVEIYSCDIVAEPAANPSGLFSQADTKPKTIQKMTPEEIKTAVDSALSAALEPMLSRLSKLESCIPGEPKKPEGDVELNARLAKVAELAALEVIKRFGLSAPAAAQHSASAVAKQEKRFEEIVRDLKASGKTHNDAMRTALSAHGKEYQDYQRRVQTGNDVQMF